MSRDQILNSIRAGLAKNRPWLEVEAAKAPHTPPPFVHPQEDDLPAQFANELGKLAGKAYRAEDDEAALEIIAGIVHKKGATSAITWELSSINLPGLAELLREAGVSLLDSQVSGMDGARKERLQTLEPALVCISGADVGIAESGSLLLRHAPGKPRLASLLAPAHIAVLRESQLVRGLGEALALVRQRHGDDIFDTTSNITLITGPSRTADIEMTLSLGIHGPPEIHVVLIGDQR
ncbi:MAG: lactate utilization protein [Chloroflexaceae bacterium]|nr:lactate utilization protein [Chloroflexaceae bacterium]